MVSISSIAFAVRSASQASSFPIKLSLAQQLVASALGYKSLAAFQAKESKNLSIADAKHFILDLNLLSNRKGQLSISNSLPELESYIQSGIRQYLPDAQFHDSLDNFIYKYVTPMIDDTVLNDDQTTSEMALTNGDGVDEVYIPIESFEFDQLPPIGQQLVMNLDGHVSMGIDTERPYAGHMIYVSATLTLERTGKNNFAEPLCEVIDANLDTDWR